MELKLADAEASDCDSNEEGSPFAPYAPVFDVTTANPAQDWIGLFQTKARPQVDDGVWQASVEQYGDSLLPVAKVLPHKSFEVCPAPMKQRACKLS